MPIFVVNNLQAFGPTVIPSYFLTSHGHISKDIIYKGSLHPKKAKKPDLISIRKRCALSYVCTMTEALISAPTDGSGRNVATFI